MNPADKDQGLKDIKNLYRNLLDREADPSGLDYWYHTVLSVQEIEKQLRASDKLRLVREENNRNSKIRNLYQSILSREPDRDGLEYWERSSLSISSIKKILRQSNEFKRITEKKQRTKEIKNLYRSVLEREPEYSALNYWENSPFSIKDIELKLRESVEHKRLTTIKDIYRQILGREITPFELHIWTHAKLSIPQIEMGCITLANTLKTQWSGYQKRVCSHTIKPLSEVVEEAFQIPSVQWKGSLNILMPGKTGELLLLLSFLPNLRTMIPQAKIILHTLSHYIDIIKNVQDQPDEIRSIEAPTQQLADSVVVSILTNPIIGFEIKEKDLWVSAYRTSYFYNLDEAHSFSPFYKAFADAIGALPFSMKKPTWLPLQRNNTPSPIALALATTNSHSSIRQVLPLSSIQWENLAKTLRKRGLTPVATGHREDPAPQSMPGWQWIDCNLVDTVTMVLQAEYILASITGLSFLAAAFGKAQTVIIDELNFGWNWLRYGLEPFKGVIDISKMWSIHINPNGSQDEQAYQLALRIAQNQNLRDGCTYGYSL